MQVDDHDVWESFWISHVMVPMRVYYWPHESRIDLCKIPFFQLDCLITVISKTHFLISLSLSLVHAFRPLIVLLCIWIGFLFHSKYCVYLASFSHSVWVGLSVWIVVAWNWNPRFWVSFRVEFQNQQTLFIWFDLISWLEFNDRWRSQCSPPLEAQGI